MTSSGKNTFNEAVSLGLIREDAFNKRKEISDKKE